MISAVPYQTIPNELTGPGSKRELPELSARSEIFMRVNTGNLIIQAGLRPVLVFALIFMAIVIMVGVSGAQTPRTGRPARGPALAVADRYAWQHGYRAGYTDGHARGKSDFNDGNPRDFSGSEAYDNANRTYAESMGTLAEYREGYRLGFEVGYQDGYFGRVATNSIPANIGRIVVATLNSTSGQPGSLGSTAGMASGGVTSGGVTSGGVSRNGAPASRESAGQPGSVGQPGQAAGRSRTVVFVPANIEMKMRLTSSINTKSDHEGGRFTAVVLDPGEYADGTVEGHIAALKRSGKATGKTELSLAFDTLRLRDGRTLRLAGQVVRVYESETVRTVDEEGNVQSGSRTKDTATRGVGGAAIGAIIGAIAGGGKGAAIGAIIGAGAGAGSVFIQGDRDLILDPGTEILIRTAAPENANPRSQDRP
jgi:outer membrane lipoprotein SlyB